MRSKTLLALAVLIATVTGSAQITYYIQGLHRQGNAEDARNYLGVGFVVTNWFTTSAPNATVPLNLLTNITAVQLSSNTWFLATNFISYTNNAQLVGIIVGSGIGTNTTHLMPTNFYNNANTALKPGVVSGDAIGTNYAGLFTLPDNVLTNRQTTPTVISNFLYLEASGGNPTLYFIGTSGTIGWGSDVSLVGSYISFGPVGEIAAQKDLVSGTDGLYNLGRGPAAVRWKNIFLKGGACISSNSLGLGRLVNLTYGDNLYISSNGVPHVIWMDGAGTITTNRLVP